MGVFDVFKNLFGNSDNIDLKEIIRHGAYLVDVRTPAEFDKGHVKGSVNIPLKTLGSQLSKLKGKERIVVFCQSGIRSSQAKTLLEKNGFTNVFNGGTWNNVKQFVI